MIAGLVKKFGVLGSLLIAGLLLLVLWLAASNAWHRVSGWWEGRKLDQVTAQRDVARADARNAETSADVAGRADEALDDRLDAHRGAASQTQVVIRERILQGAGAAAGDDPDILRAVDAAHGRAQAAAAAVQGAGKPGADSGTSR